MEEGIVRELGIDMYTLLYLKWISSENLQYSAGDSAQCYVAVWMEGGFGGEGIHVHLRWRHSAVHLKLSQDSLSAILQCKIKSKNIGRIERLLLNHERHWDSWPPEKNSIRGQRRGLIIQSFRVINTY